MRQYNPEEIREQELARRWELRYGPTTVDPGNYWRLLEALCARRREKAFRTWQASGWRDRAAQAEFVAMFTAANDAHMQAQRVGA